MSGNITVAALGQPFTLGMLYNACKDELLPGLSLWDPSSLEKMTSESNQRSSSFQISSSDTIESRSSLMDIECSLKASFFGGLVDISGSAKYLNDEKQFKNQSRVTFQYKASTHFKQLSLTSFGQLDSQQKAMLAKCNATHVVTGILYGANAFFVFDSEKLESSNVQDIQGSMEAVIRKIPSFEFEGKVKLQLTSKEQSLTNKFTCKFYGDLLLSRNPATFEDAVKTYCELPNLLGDKGENTSPLKVWLTPVSILDSQAAVLKSTLSIGLVKKIQDALEDGREMEMRCNDLLTSSVAKNFPEVRKELSSFRKLCGYYTSTLQQMLAKKIPAIREGKEDESALKQLLDDRAKSPYSKEYLTKWIVAKERDVNIIGSCHDMMTTNTNAKVVRNKYELDKVVLTQGVSNVLCYVFTNLDTVDPCLDFMAKYLESLQLQGTAPNPSSFPTDVVTVMRQKAKEFLGFCKPMSGSSSIKFLITAMRDSKYKASSIYHYKDGKLASDSFVQPSLKPVKTITDRDDLIWYFTDVTLDSDTVNPELTLSQGNKRVTKTGYHSYTDIPERFDKVHQVMGKEPLSDRHYWEMDESGVCAMGVAYRHTPRKGDDPRTFFGCNNDSWVVTFDSWLLPAHGGMIEFLMTSGLSISRVGIFLDWPGGTLSYYSVSGEKVQHLHTFQTQFHKPLFPAFYVPKANKFVSLL